MSIDRAPSGQPARAVLSYRDLEEAGFGSRVTIWRKVRAGEFPAPRDLGHGRIGFIRAEVDAWLAARPVAMIAPISEVAVA